MIFKKVFLALVLLYSISISLYGNTDSHVKHKPIVLPLEVIRVINHDSKTYTQGLFFDDNNRYESSGLYGKSFIRRFDSNGQQTQNLAPRYFAEGLTVIDNTLYLLTWKAQTLLLFDKNTLKPKGRMQYQGQGWGLTHNDNHFIMSNGSNRLSFRNLESFAIEKTLVVPNVNKLNELEYIDGIIWANRWYDDTLYAISEHTGCVVGTLDISSLRKQAVKRLSDNVSNGIAYDSANNALLVTGKYWDKQFYIRLPKIESDIKAPCYSQR